MKSKYEIINISFEGIGEEPFASNANFVKTFMDLCVDTFRFTNISQEEDEKFIESQGRLLFLCFLKPIINGTGFYYVEPQTRTSNRMDIVVTYLEEEFIIELKIWHGDQYRKDGIKQLNGYLESREQKKGYLVSFSFLKNKEYTAGYLSDVTTEEVPGIEDKEIYEVIV